MHSSELSSRISQLKGSLLTIMIAMMCQQHPTRSREVSEITGYSLRTIKGCLKTLRQQGMVVCPAQDDMWALSRKAKRMMRDIAAMFGVPADKRQETGQLAPVVKNFPHRVSSSSSSRCDINTSPKKHKKLQLPPSKPPPKTIGTRKAQPDDLPHDPKIQQAYRLLLDTGIGQHTAAKGIRTALEAGWSGDKICRSVEGWLAYAASDLGTSVKHPGFFTAKRLKILQTPPKEFSRLPKAQSNPYTSGKYGHLIKH